MPKLTKTIFKFCGGTGCYAHYYRIWKNETDGRFYIKHNGGLFDVTDKKWLWV